MASVYQLLIELEGSKPAVWRRVRIPESTDSFMELYDIIRILINWSHADKYYFQIEGVEIYDFDEMIDLWEDSAKRDCSDTFLDEFINKDQTPFTFYYYHAGEWKLAITAETVLANSQGQSYPKCLEGAGAGPPDECAGVEDYKALLNGLSDPDHPRRKEGLDILGEEWDPNFFNKDSTNFGLRDYAQQWEEIGRQTQLAMEGEELDGEPEGEYEQVKSFQSFEDWIKMEEENLRIMDVIEDCLQDRETNVYQAFYRIKNEGIDEQSARELLRDVIAIEEYYEVKHGIMELPERFRYNLENLPNKPLEIPDTWAAIQILDFCNKGIPFKAIAFLQNDSSEEASNAILQRLKLIPDINYEWNDRFFNPIYFAIAAEGHISEALIDPVIKLFTTDHPCRTDFLHEQGEVLNELLAEKFPDGVIPKVIEAVWEAAQYPDAHLPVLFLYNALLFGNISKYENQLLDILKNPKMPYLETWAQRLAYRQIQSAKPVIEDYIKHPDFYFERDKGIKGRYKFVDLRELEEARKELEYGESEFSDVMQPEFQRRGGWKKHYAKIEHNFYKNTYDEDFDEPSGAFNPDDEPLVENDIPERGHDSITTEPSRPLKKQSRPGRNDLCHCGSGKKYKKCCLQKDEEGTAGN